MMARSSLTYLVYLLSLTLIHVNYFIIRQSIQTAGLLVQIGCPTVEYSGIEFFKGWGGTCFVGAGGAVLGYSPLIEAAAIKNEHNDYWIAVSRSAFG